MVCSSRAPRCQGSFDVFEMFSQWKGYILQMETGHEEMVKCYRNSPEATAISLVDQDIGRKTFFYISLP